MYVNNFCVLTDFRTKKCKKKKTTTKKTTRKPAFKLFGDLLARTHTFNVVSLQVKKKIGIFVVALLSLKPLRTAEYLETRISVFHLQRGL